MPARILVTTGERYGSLSVKHEVEQHESYRRFLCRCDCGRDKIETLARLRSGAATSCNKCHWKKISARLVFGRLTVLKEKEALDGRQRNRVFECSCSCGNKADIRLQVLLESKEPSCGCYHADSVRMACSGKHVDPRNTKRWARHKLVFNGVKNRDIIFWATTFQEAPSSTVKQLMSKDQLAYLTRRLALGDAAHKSLAKIGFAYSPSTRNVVETIQNFLFKRNVIWRPNRKLPIINVAYVNRVLTGRVVPTKAKSKALCKTITRKQLYYLIYLRQVKNLSLIQIIRLSFVRTAKSILSRYGYWTNALATPSTSYVKGRKRHKAPDRITWIHPKHLVDSEPLARSDYIRRVRHFTNISVERYGHLIKNAEMLNEVGYVVDHILSVRDGFERQGRQTPWSLVCHPANLQVLSAWDNASKGSRSDQSPAQLQSAIRQFSQCNGAALIPVDTKTLRAVETKYKSIALAKLRRKS